MMEEGTEGEGLLKKLEGKCISTLPEYMNPDRRFSLPHRPADACQHPRAQTPFPMHSTINGKLRFWQGNLWQVTRPILAHHYCTAHTPGLSGYSSHSVPLRIVSLAAHFSMPVTYSCLAGRHTMLRQPETSRHLKSTCIRLGLMPSSTLQARTSNITQVF